MLLPVLRLIKTYVTNIQKRESINELGVDFFLNKIDQVSPNLRGERLVLN